MHERKDFFARIQWPLNHVLIGIAGVFLFRFALQIPEPMVYGTIGFLIWFSGDFWMLGVTLWAVKRKRSIQYVDIIKRFTRELKLAVPAAIALVFITSICIWLIQTGLKDRIDFRSPWGTFSDRPLNVITVIIFFVGFTIGPLAEEMFFRGFLYNALRQRFPLISALIIQCFLFSLTHYQRHSSGMGYLATIFAIGVILTLIYEWRKTLLATIAIHMVINFFSFSQMGALIFMNRHSPATTQSEAQKNPDWWERPSLFEIRKMKNAEEQFLHIHQTWGDNGWRLRKMQMKSLDSICRFFPDDRKACLDSKLEIARIYFFNFRDFRRAIVKANEVLEETTDEITKWRALYIKSESTYYLGDWQNYYPLQHQIEDLEYSLRKKEARE